MGSRMPHKGVVEKGDSGIMMDVQTTGYKVQSISIVEYATHLARNGVRILPGGMGTFWIEYLYGTLMRIPVFHLEPPASQEVRQILWRGRAAIASYLIEPDERHPANTWLYICTDQAYALEKLSPEMRRNVRLGLKKLAIAPLTADQLLAHGAPAFCDTQRRTGLSAGTPEEFRQYFTFRTRLPEYVFLGAWKDAQLAAFLSILEVDDWVEIEGTYSVDALLRHKPNDALIYSALSHYLVERRCRLVRNGLSPIQADGNATGLHRFKMKVGFEVRPVHRAFVPYPLLRPFVNRLTLWGVNTALRFLPEDRRLKKAGRVMAYLLGETQVPGVAEGSMSDE